MASVFARRLASGPAVIFISPPRPSAFADEDLERDNAEKTSAVHFLRFELDPVMVQALKKGTALAVGVDHPAYSAAVGAVDPAVRTSLVRSEERRVGKECRL